MNFFGYNIDSFDTFIHLFNNTELGNIIAGFSMGIWPIIAFPIVKILDKLLSDKNKILLIKIGLSLGMLIIFLTFMSFIFFKKYGNFLIIMFMICTIFTIMFQICAKIKPLKPDKYLLKHNNYEDFSKFLEDRLLEKKYKLIKTEKNYKLYENNQKNLDRLFVIDVKYETMTPEEMNELYDDVMPQINKFFDNLLNPRNNIIFVISVDKINSYFNSSLNSLLEEGKFHSVFLVGVSFGGNKIYVPNEIDAFESHWLKRSKKEIKEILEINETFKDDKKR